MKVTTGLFVGAWAREARTAGRWLARVEGAPRWAERFCMNQAQVCESNARGLAWLSVFG